jgi:hypothetical protein
MPFIETALTRWLGIEHPILLAPMRSAAGGVHDGADKPSSELHLYTECTFLRDLDG